LGSEQNRYRLLAAMLALLAMLALAGCVGETPAQNPFDPAGPVQEVQLGLLKLTMWLAGLIGAVVAVASVYIVVRFKERPGQKGEPEQIHGNARLEILWTLIPILILSVVAVPTVQAAFKLAKVPENAIHVRAVANQWWFAFEYEDFGFVEGNELRIPVGRPVALTLESNDVIHSFWVPQLAGKVDHIPNRKNTMWIQADREGIFYGQCAEFCGLQHAKMRFRVRAIPAAEFDAWVKQRTAGYRKPTEAVLARGEKVFEELCINCHAIDGFHSQGKVGPNLTTIDDRSSLGAGIMPNTTENLRAWVKNPQVIKEGVKMPVLPINDEDLDALIKYLQARKY
jgi:cytochrome c oxidase subunit II